MAKHVLEGDEMLKNGLAIKGLKSREKIHGLWIHVHSTTGSHYLVCVLDPNHHNQKKMVLNFFFFFFFLVH